MVSSTKSIIRFKNNQLSKSLRQNNFGGVDDGTNHF